LDGGRFKTFVPIVIFGNQAEAQARQALQEAMTQARTAVETLDRDPQSAEPLRRLRSKRIFWTTMSEGTLTPETLRR
jgi:hypothetical protein